MYAVVKLFDRPAYRNRVAASFGLKVTGYAEHAIIQRKLLDRLLPAVLRHCRSGDIWADFGCGNGSLEQKLLPTALLGGIIGIDIAFGSLRHCRNHSAGTAGWVCADIESAPIKPLSLNGLIAASVLQWSFDIEKSIVALTKLLKPRGIFVFSLFTDGSFHELVETQRRYGKPVRIQLPQRSTIERLLAECDFTTDFSDDFSETMLFPSALHLLRHLSAIGSTGAYMRPLTRGELKRFCSIFEAAFGTAKGVPLTYKAFFGAARKERSDG
jgi:malonyl-CoA O-methyltransferase